MPKSPLSSNENRDFFDTLKIRFRVETDLKLSTNFKTCHSEPVRTQAWESVLRKNVGKLAVFGEYGLPHQ